MRPDSLFVSGGEPRCCSSFMPCICHVATIRFVRFCFDLRLDCVVLRGWLHGWFCGSLYESLHQWMFYCVLFLCCSLM